MLASFATGAQRAMKPRISPNHSGSSLPRGDRTCLRGRMVGARAMSSADGLILVAEAHRFVSCCVVLIAYIVDLPQSGSAGGLRTVSVVRYFE